MKRCPKCNEIIEEDEVHACEGEEEYEDDEE